MIDEQKEREKFEKFYITQSKSILIPIVHNKPALHDIVLAQMKSILLLY